MCWITLSSTPSPIVSLNKCEVISGNRACLAPFEVYMNAIYVDIEMCTGMDELWKHTQDPSTHERWDLRFSEITYLPRDEGEAQHFLYRTKVHLYVQVLLNKKVG